MVSSNIMPNTIVLSKTQKIVLSAVALGLLISFLIYADNNFLPFHLRVINLCAIYIILALSLNLVNGYTGLFSLGHAGFMAVGGYTYAILTMSPAHKETVFFLQPIIAPLANVQLHFAFSLILAGLMAALFGFLVGWPALRLRGDYLAIATLGFSEIIRIIITNAQRITNGAQGLRGFSHRTIINEHGREAMVSMFPTTFVTWGLAFVAVIFMVALTRSAFGRSCKAIRDNEIAAQAMGINIARVKITSFIIASFMAGIGGALLAHLQTTIDPLLFRFLLTYNVLLVVVLGGIGSLTGSVIGAIIVMVGMEWLRFMDRIPLGIINIEPRPGMRMVVFSLVLLSVILFRQQGLMGGKEFSWDWIVNLPRRTLYFFTTLPGRFNRKKGVA